MNRAQEDVIPSRGLPERINRGAVMIQGAALLLLIGFLYHDILYRLVLDWWTDPNFSHGFFVPAVSGFVIWQQRERLRAQPFNASWFGLVVMGGALSVLIVGVLGAELFLSRSSFVLLLAGLVVYFLGWKHFRLLLFPLAFLFLMIPIPSILFNQIAFPLQLLASQFASSLLSLSGVPVLREGNIIQLPVMTLEVVEACSGIRSLMSLATVALIYGYFLEPSNIRRVLLALASVPIAVIANGLRIVGTGLLGQFWSPEKAEGFFHNFSGWVIYVLSMLLLFGTHGVMRAVDRWRGVKPIDSTK